MRPLAQLSPAPALALAAVLGAACASDPPRDEPAASPPEATPQPRTVPGQLAPPPSALQGATAVWTRIQETCGDRARLRSLKSSTVVGDDDRPDRIHVRLDLIVVGDDALDATAQYVALLDALSEAPWCENVQRAPTGVFDSGQALGVHGLKILYLPGESDWSEGVLDEDPELAASSLAAKGGLGTLDSRVTRRRPERDIEATIYGFRLTERDSSHPLATILGFAGALEERTANLSITSLDLRTRRRSRDAEPSDEWTFELELTSRAKNGG